MVILITFILNLFTGRIPPISQVVLLWLFLPLIPLIPIALWWLLIPRLPAKKLHHLQEVLRAGAGTDELWVREREQLPETDEVPDEPERQGNFRVDK